MLTRSVVQRWRRFRYLYGPQNRHRCLKCGFLSFRNGDEVAETGRRLISAEGKAGWWTEKAPVHCLKHMWDWEDDDPFNVVIYEANRPRRSCSGFYRWVYGRSPAEHFKLEDERRTFLHQRRLAWLAFLGGMIGAIIGAAVAFLARP